MTVHSSPYTLAADGQGPFSVACGANQKAAGGGFDSGGSVVRVRQQPNASDDGWNLYLVNLDQSTGASGTIYVTCLG